MLIIRNRDTGREAGKLLKATAEGPNAASDCWLIRLTFRQGYRVPDA